MSQTETDWAPVEKLLPLVVDAAWEKKARNIIALDTRETTPHGDVIVICSGTTDRHVRAISDNVERALTDIAGGIKPDVEGRNYNRWILMDFGGLVVHVFLEPIREMYELERLWSNAAPIPLDLKEQEDDVEMEEW